MNETPTGLLLNSPNLQKQASKEKPSVMRKFNPKWKEEFPWLSFNAAENVMICDLCRAYSSVAGNTNFLKGCSNFKKETIRKHANSNGHIRARDRSQSKENSITESQIAQSFSKIYNLKSGKKWKPKSTPLILLLKKSRHFQNLRGCCCCREKMESH